MSVARVTHTWRIADQNRAQVRTLAEAIGVPPIMAHLMILRGITDPEEARSFLLPSLSQISDPFLLTDMDKAVARITLARDRDEQVLIFGDYDVDGIAGTAILTNALRRFGLRRVTYAMPQRQGDGYGLSADQVDAAWQEGVSLLVTVDNGISAYSAAARARELGIDLVITDHHATDNGLPDAVAVVNPKREAPSHPAYHLCGAGVGFKLATALNGTPNDLDLVALGTVADIVPMLGENRALVFLGLRHLSKYGRPGLAKLAQSAGVNLQDVTAEQVGFQLAPRLNAAGRLDDAMLALKLLMAEDPAEADRMAQRLNAANTERRSIEKQIFEEAVEEVDTWFQSSQRGIVLAHRAWHIGVIGIVAARIQTRYHRPVVLIAMDDAGWGRGSARSGPGFDMVGAFSACQNLLERFGGHRSAAGLTIREANIPEFREAFESEALRQLGPGEIIPELAIDVLAAFSQIDGALLRALERLEPVGQGNPSPVFCSMGVELLPQSTRVLKDRHLKMSLRQGDSVFPAIGFNMAERFYTESLPRTLDVAYTPQLNSFRGDTVVQLVLRDIRPAE